MIYLNGKTEKDYNANYIHWECTAPEPKLDPVEVPMRDGLIYCNEMLSSRIFFKARTITAKMELRGLRGEWPIVYSQILQDLHGKEVEVERSEDPGWIWTGHAVVGPLEEHGASARRRNGSSKKRSFCPETKILRLTCHSCEDIRNSRPRPPE